MYEIYTAQCMWDLTRAVYGLGGNEYNLPQYVELIYPETKRNQPTAQEIKDRLVKMLEA